MKFNKVKFLIVKNRLLISILMLSFVLRFYSYPQRWALAYDQAWFAVIARYALSTFQIPLLGPFASGGPFQTGGEWFWVVMIGVIMNPSSVIAPWIFITLISVLQILLLYYLGRKYVNRKFGLIVALLGAVSTSQTLQATNLTNQTIESFFTIILLIAVTKIIKTKKLIYYFLVGLSVGFASAMHLQGILLIPIVVITLILTKSFNVKKVLLVILGIVIPWLPVLIVDLQNDFYNTRNILLYFSHSQSQVTYEELGRRWLTYILDFVPSFWSRTIGGYKLIGYIEIFLVSIVVVVSVIKKKMKVEWVILIISSLVLTIILRYIKTPLYENYLTFMHPLIFMLVGWGIYTLINYKRYLGILAIILIVIGSLHSTLREVSNSTNDTAIFTSRYVSILKAKYPDHKFAIYDYNQTYKHKTLPLVYYLQVNDLLNEQGTKIGISVATSGANQLFTYHKVIDGNIGGHQLFDLSASDSSQLQKNGWFMVTPKNIYDSVQYWYKE